MLRRVGKGVVIVLGVVVLVYPVALILTYLLFPLWAWVETTYGIESVGHASVAAWCFYTVYGMCLLVALLATYVVQHKPRSITSPR